MTAVAMLSGESRRWGVRDDDDGEEEVMEVDDKDETTTTSASPPPATTGLSPPRQIHPPRPSPVSPVEGGRVAAAATTTTRNDVAVLHRWRLDVGDAHADGANAMAGCGNR